MKKSVSHTRQHCLKINNTTTGPGAAPGGLLAAYVPGDTNTGSIYTSRAYGSVYTNRAQLRRCPTPLLLSRTRTEERGEFVPATPLAANFAHPIGGGSRLFTLTAERRHERGSKVFILIKEHYSYRLVAFSTFIAKAEADCGNTPGGLHHYEITHLHYANESHYAGLRTHSKRNHAHFFPVLL
jgi:hypothetical protein